MPMHTHQGQFSVVSVDEKQPLSVRYSSGYLLVFLL
jgi:hypothetical protein